MASLDGDNNESGLMASINITPFVDVVLVLLVIFMITAPMLVKEILELRLPKTVSGDGQATQTLGVAVNRDGNILLNGSLVDEEYFKNAIQSAITGNAETQAIIAADVDVPYGKVIRVIDLMKSSGLNKFAVQIEKEEKKGP